MSCQSLGRCLVQPRKNLWSGKIGFQTFGGYATPAVAQTDGFRLKGSRCLFKSGNFIVKNYGHGDVHLYVCV